MSADFVSEYPFGEVCIKNTLNKNDIKQLFIFYQLALIIGDFHCPMRTVGIPESFYDLLVT